MPIVERPTPEERASDEAAAIKQGLGHDRYGASDCSDLCLACGFISGRESMRAQMADEDAARKAAKKARMRK